MPVFFALALMLNACSDDTDDHKQAKEVNFNLRTSAQSYGYVPLLRSVPAGYTVDMGTNGNINTDLVIYITKADEVVQEVLFKWSTANQWSKKVPIEPSSGSSDYYYIYGYMPADAATATISPYTNNDYSTGSQMVLTGLNTVSTKDLCVITSAATDDYTSAGKFYITVQDGDNDLYLLMNHLYAKLRLDYKVEGTSNYYNLRAIKLKQVDMVTSIGGVTITIKSDPNYSIQTTYTPSSSTSEQTVTILDVAHDNDDTNDDGIEITPTGITVPAFFTPMPNGTSRNIVFISTYDVYYRNTDGTVSDKIVRKDCTARNEWTLKALDGDFGAGKQVIVSATIAPTYLYQLTDPDLDNPTIKLN